MKKINVLQMVNTVGGTSLTCGWVGVLAVASLGSGLGMIIGATSGLYSDVRRCWNS